MVGVHPSLIISLHHQQLLIQRKNRHLVTAPVAWHWPRRQGERTGGEDRVERTGGEEGKEDGEKRGRETYMYNRN